MVQVCKPADLQDAEDFMRRAKGGGDFAPSFVAPLRGFDSVAGEVVTSDNPIVRGLVGRTGINPSVLAEDDIGKGIVAFERQRAAGESLTNVAVQAAYDSNAQRFTGRGPFPIKAGNIGAKRWEDVISNDTLVGKMDEGAQAAASDYQRVIEEVELLRVDAGLRPRATSGPDSVKEGWHYVPRQVEGLRGIELRRSSSPNLSRVHEEATEGAARGVDYSNDPRANLELHIRNAYREVAEKQLSDFVEARSLTPKQLIPEGTRVRMEKAVEARKAAERRRRSLTVGRGLEGADPAAARGLRGTVTADRRQADAALEAVRVEYNTAKTKYSAALKSARRKEVAPGELFGVDAPEIPIATWRNRFLPREQADALNDTLGGFLKPREGANWLALGFEKTGNYVRFLSAVGDFAAPFIQGLPLLARNPAGWGKATLRHYQAFVDPSVQARFIRENLEIYQEMAAYNVPVGDVEFFAALREGGGIPVGRLLELLPKGKAAREAAQLGGKQTFGRFQASYDTFLSIARVELWKGLKPQFKGNLDELATHVRNMTGGLDSRALGVGPSQRGFESTWLAFSPRLLRSTTALVADLRLGLRNPRGLEAWRTLGTLTTGVVGIYTAAGLAQGKSWEEIRQGLNPLEGKRFLSYEVNGDHIGIGGQFRAITQLMARSAANPEDLLSADQFDNPLLSFASSRGAPGLRIGQSLVEAGTGGDVDALPFDKVDSLPSLVSQLGQSALPFALQGKLEGENWATTGAALLGARTSPGTPGEEFKSAFQQATGQEYVGDPLQKDKARQNPQLAPLLQAWEEEQRGRGFGGAVQAGERAEILAERAQEAALPETAQRIEAGDLEAAPEFREDIGELRKLYGELVGRDLFGVEFDAPESEAAKKYVEYIELRRNDFASDEDYEAARDTAFDAIPEEQKGIIRNRVRSQAPGVQKFEKRLAQDRQAIEKPTFTYKGVTADYWGVWDALWEQMQPEVEKRLPGVKTRGDLRGLAGQFGQEQANSIQNKLSAFVSDMRQRMRSSNPELDARLRFWGYTGTLMREQDSFDAFNRLYPNTTPPRAAAN